MFKNHPKGLLTAALSNMGERLCYLFQSSRHRKILVGY